MKRIVFLCSGGGGNFRFIKRSIDLGVLSNLSVDAVIADRDCAAIRYAASEGVANHLIAYSQKEPSRLYDLLDGINPDLVITNIHKILDHRIVSRFNDRLVNLHYSLLPAYKGLIGAEPLKRALQLDSRIVGTTAHHVVEEVDAGKIISQSALAVDSATPLEVSMDRLFRSGCINLANAIDILAAAPTSGQPAAPFALVQSTFISPAPRFQTEILDEEFWQSLR